MELPPDVEIELDQISHRGKGPAVKELVVAARTSLSDGEFAEALEFARQAKPMAPRSATVRELMGLAQYHLGRYQEAAANLSAYRRLSDRHDQNHVIADCYRALGRPEHALETLDEHPVTSGEIGVESLIIAAGALSDLGRFNEAVQRLKTGPLRPRPVRDYHLRLWYALADALEKAGRRSESRQWWDFVFAEDPDFFDVASRRLSAK